MENVKIKKLTSQAYEEGNGIFRLAPTWVHRPLWMEKPGGRLKLAPKELYSERGGSKREMVFFNSKS